MPPIVVLVGAGPSIDGTPRLRASTRVAAVGAGLDDAELTWFGAKGSPVAVPTRGRRRVHPGGWRGATEVAKGTQGDRDESADRCRQVSAARSRCVRVTRRCCGRSMDSMRRAGVSAELCHPRWSTTGAQRDPHADIMRARAAAERGKPISRDADEHVRQEGAPPIRAAPPNPAQVSVRRPASSRSPSAGCPDGCAATRWMR